VVQETRLYDPERDETRSMRTKEDAQDYRYFPDPDLLPLVISEEMIRNVQSSMPELPDVLRERFIHEYEFPDEMVTVLTSSREKAKHFEEFWRTLLAETEHVDHAARVKGANWAMVEIGSELNRTGHSIESISPGNLGVLVARIIDGTISHRIAKEVFDAMVAGEGTPDEIIDKRGFRQISDAVVIEKVVDDVVIANAHLVADYRAGKEKAFNALVGQVMKATKGRANPVQASEALRRRIAR